MSKGLENIGFINGLITKVYSLGGGAYATIFQDSRQGDLKAFIVDDGLDVTEYEYAESSSQVRQQNRPGFLPGGSDS